jgi:hypothetical protein
LLLCAHAKVCGVLRTPCLAGTLERDLDVFLQVTTGYDDANNWAEAYLAEHGARAMLKPIHVDAMDKGDLLPYIALSQFFQR